MSKESIKPFVQGIVAGAIVLLIVIFWTGWVVTSNTAEADAKEMTEKAVVGSLTDICVAQFQQDPDKTELLVELKETSSYQRDDYVEEKGWATMPGAEESKSKVAEESKSKVAGECAKRLVELDQ